MHEIITQGCIASSYLAPLVLMATAGQTIKEDRESTFFGLVCAYLLSMDLKARELRTQVPMRRVCPDRVGGEL